MAGQSVGGAVQQFAEDVKRLYDDDLLSVILYGSAASGKYVPGRSNINTLILLKEITPAQLTKCVKFLRGWRRKGIVTPLFLDPAYVHSSADAFPIEFLDMKDRYRVLYGRDFLCDLQLNLANLRFQCEHELKGKLLKLRQFYLEASRSSRALRGLITSSVASFLILFKSLLRLKGILPPHSPEEILARLSELGLPTETLARAVKLKHGAVKLPRQELQGFFEPYLVEIQAAADFFDAMRVQDQETAG